MSLREQMPGVAAFIDQLREAFGRDEIDGQIKRGMRGEPTFFAQENGHAIGTPIPVELEVPLFGPEREERTAEGQRQIQIDNLKRRKRR